MLVVCLNGSRGNSSMIAVVSKELMELDEGVACFSGRSLPPREV